jgi:RNA polymerase sigma-70 factor, ECF subfamily
MSQPHDLERFREFLSLLARAGTGARWQGKIDLSGVVQQTLLEAFQAGKHLDSCNEAQKAAWLKQALTHNLADEMRKQTAAKRGAGRERSLEVEVADSMSRLEHLHPATYSTPSKKLVQEERLLIVSRMLASLPEAQRQVIELHHLGGQSLADVAQALGATKPAVAGLLHRGLKKLRELLAEEETHTHS